MKNSLVNRKQMPFHGKFGIITKIKIYLKKLK